MKSKIKVKRWLGLEEDSGFLTGGHSGSKFSQSWNLTMKAYNFLSLEEEIPDLENMIFVRRLFVNNRALHTCQPSPVGAFSSKGL